MDPATFQKELQKYKVVRLEDYYHPKMKVVTKAKQPQLTAADKERKAAAAKAGTNAVAGGDKNNFWVLMEKALKDVLSPSEVAEFIGEMKKGMEEDVPRTLNLEDLDIAAGSIVAAK
mmetsp:Transcript_19619/g.32810  ORF Transcript_19619/g.32810 Transcript_19619/m.32810 type:complete len:117 (+) Transcript_19619:131-481(+)|eukprot:CAMPEP_0174990010 /NCGR_PEP_ID=MMETSP0004_2-20121128/21064_1 /TAXON_ID=420556 /ORGANISM="Ochromonas sp., Strain CCMP1393" /LENGTH=116 /DNA_ID=CAMNT_0016243531 /DNA_START=218 /DNA_END=568 /DNA_ORIENTATION=-